MKRRRPGRGGNQEGTPEDGMESWPFAFLSVSFPFDLISFRVVIYIGRWHVSLKEGELYVKVSNKGGQHESEQRIWCMAFTDDQSGYPFIYRTSISEKKSMRGEMSFRPLVRPHHLLQSDGFQSSMTKWNGHQFLLPYPSSRVPSSRLLPLRH